jgi:hypothetical protein
VTSDTGDRRIAYVVRAREPGAAPTAESFATVEEAHERFGELAEERPTARLSLYGPGGTLIRRRPPTGSPCAFCTNPATGDWPVTAFGMDPGTRRREVLPLCGQHHAAVASTEAGYAFGAWTWHAGHNMS